jgi:hypothetical protein
VQLGPAVHGDEVVDDRQYGAPRRPAPTVATRVGLGFRSSGGPLQS